jgi:endonuclease/exonuclease/phosphatase family metal-dependent hydrolase
MVLRTKKGREKIARLVPGGNNGARGEARRWAVGQGDESFRVVTYNVHKCRGLDGRVRPQRIAEVLQEVGADIIALQEVVNVANGEREDHQAEFIAGEMKMYYCFGENRRFRGGGYGNLLLSRLPLISRRNFDLSRPGREERGCLRTDVVLDGSILHVYNVHLGTSYVERHHQGKKLVESEILAGADVEGPRILLGDFNEWLRGITTRLLSEQFACVDIKADLGLRATYPGPLPLVHLDNIYFDQTLRLEGAALHRSRKALIASDHLPLVADFRIERAESRAARRAE